MGRKLYPTLTNMKRESMCGVSVSVTRLCLKARASTHALVDIGEIGVLLRLTHDHASFPRRDVVRKVKTVRAKISERPAYLRVRAPERFTRVFDEKQVALGANLYEPIHVAHVAKDVHREHARVLSVIRLPSRPNPHSWCPRPRLRRRERDPSV